MKMLYEFQSQAMKKKSEKKMALIKMIPNNSTEIQRKLQKSVEIFYASFTNFGFFLFFFVSLITG